MTPKRLEPLAPLAGLVVFYGLYRTIYERAGIDRVELSFPAEAWRALPGPEATVAHLEARLTWGVAVLAFSLAFLVAAFVCLRVTWRAAGPRARKPLLLAGVVLAGLGVAAGLAGNPLSLPQVAAVLDAGFDRMGLRDGSFLLHFFNGLAIAAALLLTLAASATLLRPEGDGVEALRDQSRRLRRVLYAGAAVLIAGSAQAATMHRLPVAYLGEPWSAALEAAAQMAAVLIGTLWTLFLVALYLPAAWTLRSRFRRHAEAALPTAGEAEHRTWLADRGLDLSPAQQLKQLLAVLGPLLTSLPLAGLFELLAG